MKSHAALFAAQGDQLCAAHCCGQDEQWTYVPSSHGVLAPLFLAEQTFEDRRRRLGFSVEIPSATWLVAKSRSPKLFLVLPMRNHTTFIPWICRKLLRIAYLLDGGNNER